MKFFKSIKQHFAIVGINSFQSIQKRRFNSRNVFVISINLTQAILYVFYEATSFREYVMSVFVFSTLIVVNIAFPAFIWKMPKVFELMNNFEKTINKSK